ncbi:hypothetical protein GJ496_008284 [Pomphorhynchus laevis]|nr:hypothetical protein GJ496_008284 [Pomphorhynchus laevis]
MSQNNQEHTCLSDTLPQRQIVISIGYEPSIANEIHPHTIQSILRMRHFDFVVIDLIHPRLWTTILNKNSKFIGRYDSVLSSKEFNRSIIPVVDAYDVSQTIPEIDRIFNEHFEYISFLSLKRIIVRMPDANDPNLVNLCKIAGIICKQLKVIAGFPSSYIYAAFSMVDYSWNRWNALRLMCGLHCGLKLALCFKEDSFCSTDQLNRWLAEPVGFIIIPTKMFLTNKAGYPALPKAVQPVICKFLLRPHVQFIIQGECMHNDINDYHAYVLHLKEKCESLTVVQAHQTEFEGLILEPLQPLKDNLESAIYETFEADKAKYSKYQEAISRAIADIKLLTPPNEDKPIIVFVLGAGRGPLVDCVIEAANINKANVKITAVEKNLGCISVLISKYKYSEFPSVENVHIAEADIRTWQPTGGLANIIVSELLGSFADNELCPECLYNVERLLTEDGICIPESHASFIAPVHATRAYSNLCSMPNANENQSTNSQQTSNKEVPWVVVIEDCALIDQPQKVFEYFYPKTEDCSLNKFASLNFQNTTNVDMLITGFGGYFNSKLYNDVSISIVPGQQTNAMTSWFPMLFPLNNPVVVKPKEQIIFNIWRKTDNKKVWYEWLLVQPGLSIIHNSDGRNHRMLL